MAKTVRDVDEEKIRDCKEDIDTLLVFVSRQNHVDTGYLRELTFTGWLILRCTYRFSYRVISESSAGHGIRDSFPIASISCAELFHQRQLL